MITIATTIEPSDLADAMDDSEDLSELLNEFGRRHMPGDEWFADVADLVSEPGVVFVRKLMAAIDKVTRVAK